MTKYKLLKDLPLAKAGTNVTYKHDGLYPEIFMDGIAIGYIPDNISEWLEEIPEKPKTVHDLKKGDKYWSICYDGIRNIPVECYWYAAYTEINQRKLGLIFLTEQEAKNAIISLETANRDDKFVPEKSEKYYYWKIDEPDYTYNQYIFDKYLIEAGLAFRTEEECTSYMTDEVKRAFGYIS